MAGKHGFIGICLLVLMCSLGAGSPSPAHAEDAPKLSLTTSVQSSVKNGEFSVNIKGSQLKDLYAYELNLHYDTAKLEYKRAVSHVEGFNVSPIIEGNKIQLAHTSVGNKPGINGEKILYTLTFKGKAEGAAEIGLDNSQLVDSKLATKAEAGGSKKSINIIPGDSDDIHYVKITDDGRGKKTVETAASAKEVRIGIDQIGLDPKTRLEIKKEDLSVEFPPEVLNQLRGSLSAEQFTTATLLFTMNPLSSEDTSTIVDQLSDSNNVGLQVSGHIYELSLKLITEDNQTVTVSNFDKPVTLRLKVDASLNHKLVSVYHIKDDGTLEFRKGAYANGMISAEAEHFSKYGALEYNKTFADVPADHWAKDVITELAAKHIAGGTSSTEYEPERMVNRAEFTALLVRALQLTDIGENSFSDVTSSDWFYPEVSIAVKAGLVQGKSETEFDPLASISREEMVAMIVRAYQMQHEGDVLPVGEAFADEASVSPWAVTYVKNARALKLVEGREADMFVPQGVGSRAEAAQFIYNFLGM